MYIDTGAIYRAFTLQVLRSHIPLDATDRLVKLLQKTRIDIETGPDGTIVLLNGEDVTREIRAPEVSAKVSAVSEIPQVREVLTQKQRALAENRPVVLEGRDIGTVVFPSADLKIYMVASIQERAKRRHQELREQGFEPDFEEVAKEIEARDHLDSQRETAPLRKAKDALCLNTTDLSIEEQVDFILQKYEDRCLP